MIDVPHEAKPQQPVKHGLFFVIGPLPINILMSKKHRKKSRREKLPHPLPQWMHCKQNTDSLEIRFANYRIGEGFGFIAFSFFWFSATVQCFAHGLPDEWEGVLIGLVSLFVGLGLLGRGLAFLLPREIIRIDENGLTWRLFVVLPIWQRHIAWDKLFTVHARRYRDSFLRREFGQICIETVSGEFSASRLLSNYDELALKQTLNRFIDYYRQRHGLRSPIEEGKAARNLKRNIERLQIHETAGQLEISGNPQYSRSLRAFIVAWFSGWLLCFGTLFVNEIGQMVLNAPMIFMYCLCVMFFSIICLFTAWMVFIYFRQEWFCINANGVHHRLELRLFFRLFSVTIMQCDIPLSELHKARVYALAYESGVEIPTLQKPLRCFRHLQGFGSHRQVVRAINTTLRQLGVEKEANTREYDPMTLPENAIGRWHHHKDENSHTLSRRGRTTWYNRIALLAICAFWNGGVSVFVAVVINGFLSGENIAAISFLAVFLIPFVLIGLMILLCTFAAWSIFLHRWRIDISPECVRSRRTIFGLGSQRYWLREEIVRVALIRNRRDNRVWDTIRNPEIAAGNGYDNVYPCAVRIIGPNSDAKKVRPQELIRDLSEHEAGCIVDLIRNCVE